MHGEEYKLKKYTNKAKLVVKTGVLWFIGTIVIMTIIISILSLFGSVDTENMPSWTTLLIMAYWAWIVLYVWFPEKLKSILSRFKSKPKTYEIDRLIEERTKKLEKIDEEIANKRKIAFGGLEEELGIEKEKLDKEITLLLTSKDNLNKQISELKNEVRLLQKDAWDLRAHKDIEYLSYSFDEEMVPSEIKNELAVLNSDEKDYIKNLIQSVNNNKTDITTTPREQFRIIMRLFESESESHLKSLTLSNVDTQRSRIVRAYETINNLFKFSIVSIDKSVLEFKLKKLTLMHEYNKRKLIEDEEQKAIKAQMVEEARAERELERAKKEIEKEITQFNKESRKLLDYLNKANSEIERNIYADKIKELEERLRQLQEDKNDVENRQLNTRAGFIYIISNIGSFGENIYKIGVTRRLEPMDRVRELGSASVPFEFDVHAMIFSEDAPKLESLLHNHFRDNQVNKVNNRKEFFKVDLKEIEKVVKENHNATVTFTMKAKAEQYYETLRIEAEQIKLIDKKGKQLVN